MPQEKAAALHLVAETNLGFVALVISCIDATTIESAQFTKKLVPPDMVEPIAVDVQVLLDSAKFFPDEIDGKLGEKPGKGSFPEKALHAWITSK